MLENDSHDIWYKDYLDSGKRYIVNVDTDEDNNGSLSVFINYGIIDTNGDILGACGVGVDMNDLVDTLSGSSTPFTKQGTPMTDTLSRVV